MIGGTKRKDLTYETIISIISEYDIYRMYYPWVLILDKKIRSPMPNRKDRAPSFVVSSKSGFMFHIDYGDSRYRGNCVQFVMQMFSLTFDEALKKIDKDFGLGIVSNYKEGEYKKIISAYEQPELTEKRPVFYQVRTKKFSKEELDWWGAYHITKEELVANNVFSIKEIYVDRVRMSLPRSENLIFGYFYDEKYWKIYRPEWYLHNPLKDKEGKDLDLKWRTNCPIDLVEGLDNISGCENAIVTKSKKDYIVLRKFTPCVCAVQNESVVALNEITVRHLKSNAKNVFINYDADAPGKRNSWEVTKEFGFKHVNVPDELVQRGIKDFSDVAKHIGLEYVENYLKSKNII